MYVYTRMYPAHSHKKNIWGGVRKAREHTYTHSHPSRHTQTHKQHSSWGESPPPAPDMCNFADEEEEACGESVSTRGVATGVERGRGRGRDMDTETESERERERTDTDVPVYTLSPAGAPFSSAERPIPGAASTNRRLRAPLSPRPGGDRKFQVPPRMEERRTMGIYIYII